MTNKPRILIENGIIMDGTGNPWFRGDVAIEEGRITAVGKVEGFKADIKIDATNLVVCPGFIDIHGHSDLTVIVNPRAESKVMQGVTTELGGNCGQSPAPLEGYALEEAIKSAERYGIEVDWRSFGEYLDRIERQGCSMNFACLVGHGTIRWCVVGPDDRDPTEEEMERMKELVDKSMKEGAFGLSTGLMYAPGCYASTEEIIKLAKVVAKHGGIYASHIRRRGEGIRRWGLIAPRIDTLVEAVRETIEIGERAGLPAQVSHHKAMGRVNWGKVRKTLSLIEDARLRGVDVTADQYPYTAASSSLASIFPAWARAGGTEKLIERLKDPEIREKIREETIENMEGIGAEYGWEDAYISNLKSEKNSHLVGKSLKEAAEILGKHPFDVAADLLIEEEGAVSIVYFAMCEEDVETVMKNRNVMVGSDGYALSPEGVLGRGKPHPRSYGAFPRVLGVYVRERRVIPWEEAIRKMTSMPAQKMGLFDRGLLRKGMWADIVVFNPRTVRDRATFENPHRFPEGIEYVLVNGELVVERGTHTGLTPGKVLRHKG